MARILVVDDDTLLRAAAKRVLEMAGHAVVEAGNGLEAEAAVAAQPFDLVLTDIVMPDKEGLELVRDLKRRWPALRIIAMSTGGRAGSGTLLEVATKFGADAALRKPFRGRELIAAVSAALQITDPSSVPPAA